MRKSTDTLDDEVNKSKALETKLTESKINRNYWKISFLLLIGIILGFSLFIGIRVSEPQKVNLPKVNETTTNEPTFQIQLNKTQVNDIISYYLNDFLKDSGIKYQFYLEKNALLNGTFKVLGHDMQFYLYFDPFVMENGDIQLKATSLSIGSLPLPITQVMKYVASDYEIPKWVDVQPSSKTIILHLSQFELQNGMRLAADKMNIVDDDIRFNIFLPLDKQNREKGE